MEAPGRAGTPDGDWDLDSCITVVHTDPFEHKRVRARFEFEEQEDLSGRCGPSLRYRKNAQRCGDRMERDTDQTRVPRACVVRASQGRIEAASQAR